ncbi:MAG: UDP-N-acetylmuramoyl-L-alanyl-D-glutamate--2,6-diaminopimelate ligase [Alphaproteobacteria bacterium]
MTVKTPRLSTLLKKIDLPPGDDPLRGYAVDGGDPEITALTSDSREASPGSLFAALSGSNLDGRKFIAEAIGGGASIILTDRDAALDNTGGATIIRANEPRWLLSQIAAAFFTEQPRHIAAVTGTSGKTSTVQFVRELWTAMGAQAASIGTLGVVAPEYSHYGKLTTPDPITLHKTLADLAAQGVTHASFEASSHGLALYRLDAVRVEAAGFTNLARDHLDFHGTRENYFAAKKRLFAEVMIANGTAILNADTEEAEALARIVSGRGGRVLTYGLQGKDLKLLQSAPDAHGQNLKLEILGKPYDAHLELAGNFQAWNALCALGLAIGQGADPEKAIAALGKLTGVHGRLDLAGTHESGAPVLVDYAHKPDALEAVLTALRPHVGADGRLIVVFGCGGNRDAGKRPIMGGIACRLADMTIVTDDNPRMEDPAAIRAAILAGCETSPSVHEIADRRDAIRFAVGQLRTGDVLVIAGKGHEPGQIVRDQVLPFDDGEVAREALGNTGPNLRPRAEAPIMKGKAQPQ